MEELSLDQLKQQYRELLNQVVQIKREIDRRQNKQNQIDHSILVKETNQLQYDLFNEYGVCISYEGDNSTQLIGTIPVVTFSTWVFVVNSCGSILAVTWGLDMLNGADPRFKQLAQNINLLKSSGTNKELHLNIHVRTDYELDKSKMAHHTELYYRIESEKTYRLSNKVLRTTDGDFICLCNRDTIYSLEGKECRCKSRDLRVKRDELDGLNTILLPIL